MSNGWMNECKNGVAITMCHREYETWIPKWPGHEECYWHGGHELTVCRIVVCYV